MICKKCGKQIDDNSKFCEYCGSKIEIVNNSNGDYSWINETKTNVSTEPIAVTNPFQIPEQSINPIISATTDEVKTPLQEVKQTVESNVNLVEPIVAPTSSTQQQDFIAQPVEEEVELTPFTDLEPKEEISAPIIKDEAPIQKDNIAKQTQETVQIPSPQPVQSTPIMKQEQHKKKGSLLPLVIVLIIIILGLAGYIVYDKLIVKQDNKCDSTESIKNDETVDDNVNEQPDSNTTNNPISTTASEQTAKTIISGIETAYTTASLSANGGLPTIEDVSKEFAVTGANMSSDGILTLEDKNVICTKEEGTKLSYNCVVNGDEAKTYNTTAEMNLSE